MLPTPNRGIGSSGQPCLARDPMGLFVSDQAQRAPATVNERLFSN